MTRDGPSMSMITWSAVMNDPLVNANLTCHLCRKRYKSVALPFNRLKLGRVWCMYWLEMMKARCLAKEKRKTSDGNICDRLETITRETHN